MKNVVITGSTRGVGLGLVQAFLNRGCAVVKKNLTVFEFVIENIKYVLIKKRRTNEYN